MPVEQYVSAASTDQGFVRSNNEDRVYCDDARGFFVVVDGMGGHEAGEQAADIAIESLRSRLERPTDNPEQRLREAITLANNAIYEAAQRRTEWRGMACVVTAAIIEDGQVTIGHVGDTRLYRIKRGMIEKITHDHSPVGEREDSGELTEAEAMRHPRRNEVYRDVGSEERTPDGADFIEILHLPFEADSALLLCSDGLSDAIPSGKILRIIEEHAGDRWGTVRALIAAANQVGKDNVSAVLVEGDQFAVSYGKSPVGTSSVVSAMDPASGEITGRLSAPGIRPSPWYRSTAAILFYGILLGALSALAAIQFLARSKPSVPERRVLLVTPKTTITAALERVRPGDTLSVAPGTYVESVTLKEGVNVVSERVREAIIKGSVIANGIQNARLEGFQIHGTAEGVTIRDSDVILSRDEISDARGPGVEFAGNSRGAIFACDIHNNAGAGIVVSDSASPSIENNQLRDNGTQPELLRPGLFIRSVLHPHAIANVFAGNGADAIWLPAADEIMIQRNYFVARNSPDRHPPFRIVPLQQGKP